MTVLAPPTEGPEDPKVIRVMYRNWRGELEARRILTRALWFGSTEWHPTPQWFILGYCYDRGEWRDFALTGFTGPAK